MNDILAIWDSADAFSDAHVVVLDWRSYNQSPQVTSIPRYVDDNGERLRSKYLSFIHDLGESPNPDRAVIDALQCPDGYNLWWMGQVAEKSPFKSSGVYESLKILATEELLLERRPQRVILKSSDKRLAEALEKLCDGLGIDLEWKRAKPVSAKWTVSLLFRRLPYVCQGLISLIRYISIRLPLLRLRKPLWFRGDDSVFFCSYFFNLDVGLAADGIFGSRQWGALPELIEKKALKSNWAHHFLTIPGMPGAVECADLIRSFNQRNGAVSRHAFVDAFVTGKVVFRALRRWLWLLLQGRKLKNISAAFTPRGSAAWLWPFLQSDWHSSVSGQVAMCNCLWIELFDTMVSELPKQRVGFYLWENQGWEAAFVHAWSKYGHGEIIGIPHATVCFWHLNNFDDPRTRLSQTGNAKPWPSRLAVNGPMALEAFVGTGYPREYLTEVEALRFSHLDNIDASPRLASDQPAGQGDLVGKTLAKRVLVFGDFTALQTEKMLECAAAAKEIITSDVTWVVKLHPACCIPRRNFGSVQFEFATDSLATLLRTSDFAFASNSTSAGLDAYLAGLPVGIFLDDATLNNSPLRGVTDVCFISSATGLAHAIDTSRNNLRIHRSVDEIFWLDPKLSRWKTLLTEALGPIAPT